MSNISEIHFHFQIVGKAYIGGNVKSSQDIELTLDPNDKNYLTDFIIKIKHDDQFEAENMARERAARLINLLVYTTKMKIEYNLIGNSVIYDNNRRTVCRITKFRYNIHNNVNIDLTDPVTSLLISSDSDLNQQLARFKDGHDALIQNKPDVAIQKFHQVIENSGLPESDYYKSLRHAVSHDVLNNSNTISDLNKFGITMNQGESLNVNDPNLREILDNEAKKLRSIAENYLKTKI